MSTNHLHSSPARLADPNSYTRYLIEVAIKEVAGPIDPPVKEQENTALLSNCALTGTPLPVSVSGLGGKECSVCVHSVYVDEVGLHSPLTVELQFVVCVI